MIRKMIWGVLLVLMMAGTSWAADFDDFFMDDLFVDLEVDEGGLAPEEALLVQERLVVGGSYSLSFNASRISIESREPSSQWRGAMGGQLYLDARPDPNFRVFGKAGLNYSLSDGGADVQVKVQELFADFNYGNKVFFRAGKQNVKWGVGYFYSPADIINIGRIDPLDPEAEREGPVALKAHYPKGSNNYYLYTLVDSTKEDVRIAFAPKMELVLGKSELGLGGFYKQDQVPRLMATLSSSFGDVGFFGEAVLSFGSQRGFLEQRGPLYEIVEKEGLFLQLTAGGMYRFRDREGNLDLSATFQYYFNGEGYGDQEGIKKVRQALLKGELPPVLNPQKLGTLALTGSGRHYAAGSLSWNSILGSKLSALMLVQANLSDQSGIVYAVLRLPEWHKLSPSIGVSTNFGPSGSEFGGTGRTVTVFAAVSISGAF